MFRKTLNGKQSEFYKAASIISTGKRIIQIFVVCIHSEFDVLKFDFFIKLFNYSNKKLFVLRQVFNTIYHDEIKCLLDDLN